MFEEFLRAIRGEEESLQVQNQHWRESGQAQPLVGINLSEGEGKERWREEEEVGRREGEERREEREGQEKERRGGERKKK